MAVNHFDKAARFAVQLDPVAFLGWALRVSDEGFAFRGWLDTRGVPFPGESDRTGDTVARLDTGSGDQPPWAVAIEFQTEPDAQMFGRLLMYLGDLWQAREPDEERGSRFNVGAVVMNLTGNGTASRRMEWPAAGLTTHLGAVERNLASENADELLGTIESGGRSRCLLPWIPLMIGGDDPGIIERWKKVAVTEPLSRRRSDFAGLALIFADAADRKTIWAKALEGWNVKESTVVKEWIQEGKAEGKMDGERQTSIAAVVAVLEARFSTIPAELEATIRATSEVARLRSWLPIAATVATLEEFRKAAGI